MRIGVAQTRPTRGDIRRNIASHKAWINLAADHRAEAIIFPELSLTGYEPELAKKLAMAADDPRLDDFQDISEKRKITIGVGVPIGNSRGINISILLFQPNSKRSIYSKKYLHRDEEPFFVPSDGGRPLPGINKAAFAICYELSVPEHSAEAFNNGAEIYIVSVAKSVQGLESAIPTLAGIATRYNMTVLMSNCVGPCEGFQSAGRSSVWNPEGTLLRQLNDTSEGLLIMDTITEHVTEVE